MPEKDSVLSSNNTIEENLQSTVIPVIEEFVSIGKQAIETGKITVKKTVEEREEVIDISLLSEEYQIDHVAVNRYVDNDIPQARYEGDILVIPVMQEVVIKRLLLVEEVRITKKTTERKEQQKIALQKEVVTIVRTPVEKGNL